MGNKDEVGVTAVTQGGAVEPHIELGRLAIAWYMDGKMLASRG